jgi:hypothetical protein
MPSQEDTPARPGTPCHGASPRPGLERPHPPPHLQPADHPVGKGFGAPGGGEGRGHPERPPHPGIGLEVKEGGGPVGKDAGGTAPIGLGARSGARPCAFARAGSAIRLEPGKGGPEEKVTPAVLHPEGDAEGVGGGGGLPRNSRVRKGQLRKGRGRHLTRRWGCCRHPWPLEAGHFRRDAHPRTQDQTHPGPGDDGDSVHAALLAGWNGSDASGKVARQQQKGTLTDSVMRHRIPSYQRIPTRKWTRSGAPGAGLMTCLKIPTPSESWKTTDPASSTRRVM